MSETKFTDTKSGSCVVVIGRQFGSGGRRIGKAVASRLGISYYDKELLSEAAGSLGFSPDIFVAADEKRPSPLRSLLQGVYGIADNFHTTTMSGERLYRAQSDVIKKICSIGSCVIVGRTADYVLRGHPGLVSVFLHAPIEIRGRMILERKDATSLEQAIELARKRDHDRESYYNYFTGRHWGDASNYHLSLDSSAIPEDAVIDMIVNFASSKFSLTKNRCLTPDRMERTRQSTIR